MKRPFSRPKVEPTPKESPLVSAAMDVQVAEAIARGYWPHLKGSIGAEVEREMPNEYTNQIDSMTGHVISWANMIPIVSDYKSMTHSVNRFFAGAIGRPLNVSDGAVDVRTGFRTFETVVGRIKGANPEADRYEDRWTLEGILLVPIDGQKTYFEYRGIWDNKLRRIERTDVFVPGHPELKVFWSDDFGSNPSSPEEIAQAFRDAANRPEVLYEKPALAQVDAASPTPEPEQPSDGLTLG